MTDLFWPGDGRAVGLMSDEAFLTAMVAVENAWLRVLVDTGVAPAEAAADLTKMVSSTDVEAIAAGAECDGNPVIGLVRLLRERTGDSTGRWLHRGLTSQDVVDSALMLCVQEALFAIRSEITTQVNTLIELTHAHRDIPMVARTLTQPALPTTVGAKLATWLSGVLDAADAVTTLTLPVQAGGAAGTLAAITELTGSPNQAFAVSAALAASLGLSSAMPWHTTRSVITRTGDALVGCCDAWGRIANDVAIGARPEIGELAEGRGGSSSSMPHKNNPVLSVLIRRAALVAPHLGATLHTASAAGVDERSDGGWHTEWATLRTLTRRTAVAAAHTTELLAGLTIDTERTALNLRAAGDLLGEQRTVSELTGRPTRPGYIGCALQITDAALQRARQYLKEAT
ncbi:3-carboxy-cis,cis-muconate cycloisomerase [Mycolicibacterium goodii]|uniref:3-carboxy-cis,cis-muconate cycloisomerase n=1 Tax=Mycolicibacterium goodii TaxID=134601 RepID=UPI001BDCEF66|nr:3-carboxy-cis,cis-muconate cycloisomerase [Mycolicibacterium goodii]MBU8807364.1 3-carboxy-cis,cis-muconate cycloisomerase [Mycolicibacterium goodii]